ncbi:hypothetical protein VNO80_18898 [Phaseolus coccineus]|uniref:Uncharacterized protein n=1 Tax=Phaseolus coccineus TaxID=3886 RepID=A0AAN9QZT7_PHACN
MLLTKLSRKNVNFSSYIRKIIMNKFKCDFGRLDEPSLWLSSGLNSLAKSTRSGPKRHLCDGLIRIALRSELGRPNGQSSPKPMLD